MEVKKMVGPNKHYLRTMKEAQSDIVKPFTAGFKKLLALRKSPEDWNSAKCNIGI